MIYVSHKHSDYSLKSGKVPQKYDPQNICLKNILLHSVRKMEFYNSTFTPCEIKFTLTVK